MQTSQSQSGRQVSFIIPARNEQLLLAATIQSITEAAGHYDIAYELIVVNDGSTDATPQIAKELGAKVVDVELHNIAAVRNAGAEVATGDLFLFLDADTLLPVATLGEILQAVSQGAVGGGAAVAFDDGITWFQRKLSEAFLFYWQRIGGWAAGCCVYVRREVFQEISGFDPTYFAAEERYISETIRKHGKFVIVKNPVKTSGRKLRIYSTWHMLKVAVHSLIIKRWNLRDREGLEVLYDAPRETGSSK